ncbi:MAG: amidase [Caldilineaceae bacterium]|nr:amidase [Caldilineaceae bacterium]
MTELALSSFTALAPLLRTGELSPVELTHQLLARIETLDPRFHSYVTVLADQALAQAAAAEAEIAAGHYRGPLHGIPVAVKDLCFTQGIPTTCGSLLLRDWIPDQTATSVWKLEQAGAILLGKLHMTEFALRWHHPYRPIPVNPWGAGRWPGVSSSGSGVATAAGLCYGAIGTDTGGSIRFPAASCGTVGLKPTYGRVSRAGVFPLAASLDHIGPLTRSVADAAAMLQAMAGFDPLDPTSSRLPVPDYLAALAEGVAGIRIGVDERYITEGVQPAVSAAVHTAIRVLAELGAEIVPVTVPEPDPQQTTTAWLTLTGADALVAHEGLYPERAAEYGPFRELLDNTAKLSAQDYAKAHALRETFACQLAPLFEQMDLLLCPTMPTTAPPMDAQGNALLQPGYVRTRYTYLFNFSRNPTLSLPCGFDQEGLPISLQLVGRHFEEALLCRAGHAYEQATDWHTYVPTLLQA